MAVAPEKIQDKEHSFDRAYVAWLIKGKGHARGWMVSDKPTFRKTKGREVRRRGLAETFPYLSASPYYFLCRRHFFFWLRATSLQSAWREGGLATWFATGVPSGPFANSKYL